MPFANVAANARVRRLGSVLTLAVGCWFWAAFIGMFFTKRYPLLDPFVTWTFRIYFGAFAAGVISVIVLGPGIYAAKDLYDTFADEQTSNLDRRLTLIWCGGAGALLSLLLGIAASLLAFGVLADVKLWFIGLCWLALLVPWAALGFLGRKVIRRLNMSGQPKSARQARAGSDV